MKHRVPLRRRVAVLVGTLVLLAGTAGVTAVDASAAGASITVSGSVSSSSAVVGITTACTPTPTQPGHYTAIQFELTSGVASTITATVTPNGFRGVLSLYQGGFLPDDPVANCWSAAVGSGSGSTVTLSSPAPDVAQFGQDFSFWTLVVSGYDPSQVGSFTGSISSSDTGIVDTTPAADTTPPVITVPSAITAEATSASGAVVDYTATANDDVDGPFLPSCAPPSGSRFPIGTTTVTCTAEDSSGNKSTETFTVTVRDTTAPTITNRPPGGTYVLEATNASGATLTTLGLGITDTVDPSPTLTCTPTVPQTFSVGTHPGAISCTAKDAAGNTASASFGVTVSDTTAPTITVPAPVTAEATGPAGSVVTYTASANDAVDGAIMPTCTPASGSVFPVGATTVSCTAQDNAGNKATQTFTVTVRDTTDPVVTVPSALSVEATGPAGAAVTFTATATDTVDGALPTTCTPTSGSTFALGSTTVTCTATDTHGNTGTAGFTVTVVDTTAPTVTVPQDFSVQATGPAGAPVTFTASAVDVVDGSVPTTCSVTSGATLSIGSHLIDCTAKDSHDNVGRASFTVTVQDTEAPVVTVPADITAEATGPDGAAVPFTTSATDTVDGARPTTCTRDGEPVASGATFALGVTTVTCTATDTADNTGTNSFTVTVRDTTPPTLAVQDVTAEATGPDGAAVTFAATATDAVTATPTVACLVGTEKVTSGDVFPLGDTTVECTATDAAGNDTTKSFVVSVVDTTGPVISVPGTVVVDATSPAGAAVTYTVTARDAVRGDVPVQCAPSSGSQFPVGTTTVTCTATDAAAQSLRAALAAAAAAGTTTQATFQVVVNPYVAGGGSNAGGSNAGGSNGGGSNGGGSGGAGSAASSGGGVLASTGGDVAGLLGVAALLLLAGAVITRTATRRRRI